jgi:hypothetical protein
MEISKILCSSVLVNTSIIKFCSRAHSLIDHHYENPIDALNPVAQVFIFLGVVCRIFLGASRAWGNFIMCIAGYGLRLAVLNRSEADAIICDQVPKTIDSALRHFNLQGKMTTYAVCPKCHCTYKPEVKPGSLVHIYPELCSNSILPETGGHKAPYICDTTLVENGDRSKPVKTFLYYSFHDYLAALLSRPDLEHLIDDYCDDFMNSLTNPPSIATDVPDAAFLRGFRGPDEKKLFLDRGEEIRTVFTLNVDFFDAEGMTQRGRKTSCGIIAMSCLNLPGDIRYKPENMYLAGIVPGPDEPHLTELNHYLDPLMDDLVDSFERGVQYSRTALNRNGRVSRSAIAAAVNDLPGGRKVAALASHNSHHYCYICNTIGLKNLGNHDCHNWPRKDPRLMRKHAQDWRNATTSAEKLRLFTAHGIRWSSMWRLPYWDPTTQLVIDTMHCILEGLVQYHFRHVLLLTAANAKAPSKFIPAFSYTWMLPTDDDGVDETSMKQISKIHKLLTAPVSENNVVEINQALDKIGKKMHAFRSPALEWVAQDLDLVPAPGQRLTKIVWVREMIAWVRFMIYYW